MRGNSAMIGTVCNILEGKLCSIFTTRFKKPATKIRHEFSDKPRVGIILGTGLGDIVEELEVEADTRLQRYSALFDLDGDKPSRAIGMRAFSRRTRRGHGGPLSSL